MFSIEPLSLSFKLKLNSQVNRQMYRQQYRQFPKANLAFLISG